jgi:acetylornithine/LysW-gamma-L-lysine aminotransferase
MLQEKHRIIREVRGLGMMLAVELRFDVRDVLLDALQKGLLMLYSGRNIIRLLPPLVMDEQIVSSAIQIIDLVLTEEERRRHVH